MIQFLDDSGVPHRVTTTINHNQLTNAGFTSRHVMMGTDGKGLAIDTAGPRPGRDSPALAAVFFAFLKVEHQLHELIYAGPQVSFNIKNGKRVPKYASADHHDHVHSSVDKGVFLHWPGAPLAPVPSLPAFEPQELEMPFLYRKSNDDEIKMYEGKGQIRRGMTEVIATDLLTILDQRPDGPAAPRKEWVLRDETVKWLEGTA